MKVMHGVAGLCVHEKIEKLIKLVSVNFIN